MHEFHWVPAHHQRHASTDTKPAHGNYPTGMCVGTLCNRELNADNTELAWFWPTCPDCNTAAHHLANRHENAPTAISEPAKTTPSPER